MEALLFGYGQQDFLGARGNVFYWINLERKAGKIRLDTYVLNATVKTAALCIYTY